MNSPSILANTRGDRVGLCIKVDIVFMRVSTRLPADQYG